MEARYPCPVCLGTRMKKTTVVPGKAPVVDFCPIRGGIWFDGGEVQKIRNDAVETVQRQIELPREAHIMGCHSCYVSMDRNAEKYRICNWHKIIYCPVCDGQMERLSCKHLILDVRRECGGVWFDRNELVEIWNPGFWDNNPLSLLSGNNRASRNNAWGLLDGLYYWPDGNGIGSGAAVEAGFAAVDGSGELLSGAPEIAEVAAEAAGDMLAGAGSAMPDGAGELLSGAHEIAEVAVEAVGEVAEGVAEAILEFIAEFIGSALG